jgi:hypothetical protein
MDHGTRYLGMAGLAAAAPVSGWIGASRDDPLRGRTLKPVPRKKGPVKKPPDRPLPLPDFEP